MVGGDAAQQGIGMAAIAHSLGRGGHVSVQTRSDAGLLLGGDQADLAEIAQRLVAATAAEDEIDGWQHLPLRHLGHHETDRWRLRLRRTGLLRPLTPGGLGRPPDLAVGMKCRALVVEQGVETLGAAEAEGQGYGPEIAMHQTGGAVHLLDPVSQLTRIGYRGRESHQLHPTRAVDDRFLPDGATLGVVHVVAFIEHHGLHISQGIVAIAIDLRVEHVAEDLGGHHHDPSLTVEAQIAG